LEDQDRGGIRDGLADVGAGGAAEAVEFVPVALELVEINGAFEAEGVAGFRRPFQVSAVVLGDVPVELGRRIPAVGRTAEVGIGCARVGFIRIEIGVADFEFEPLFEGGIRLE